MDTNKIESVPYIVHESEVARSERHIKRLIIALVITIALLFASNMCWLHAWTQYDYSDDTVTVDSSGDGNANYIGEDGDITNGENSGTESTQNP